MVICIIILFLIPLFFKNFTDLQLIKLAIMPATWLL